jgi:hypothetical protein
MEMYGRLLIAGPGTLKGHEALESLKTLLDVDECQLDTNSILVFLFFINDALFRTGAFGSIWIRLKAQDRHASAFRVTSFRYSVEKERHCSAAVVFQAQFDSLFNASLQIPS